jgi:crotonobetainyl-CoA:carnitine CoA-transferase CaiB-like acyl-CoA transferase
MAGVLDGVRVLDFGRYIAGPYCATMLGYLGAEVIRIEKLKGGEDRYVYPLYWNEDGSEGNGSLFMQVGANKKSMTLNPVKPEAKDIIRRLVQSADVVVANMPIQALKSLGLDYDSLKAIKPDIIMTSISTFGPTGPYAQRGGFDGIGQVMSGAAYFSGTPGSPVKSNAPWVDFGTAIISAYATLAAIMHHRATGEGQEVEGALLRTGMTYMNGLLAEQAVLGLDRTPSANRVQTSAPSDIYKTSDGHILTHLVGDALFARWAKMVGDEDKWVNDPRFRSDQSRGDHGTIIGARMAEWCAQHTTEEVIAACEEYGVPAGPVLTPRQSLEDPQVQAMGDFYPTQMPGMDKPAPVAGPPFRLSKTPGTMRDRAPLLGEHTDAVMRDLGYSDAEIAEFRAKRII